MRMCLSASVHRCSNNSYSCCCNALMFCMSVQRLSITVTSYPSFSIGSMAGIAFIFLICCLVMCMRMRRDMRLRATVIADSLVFTCLQLIVLSIVAGTLLIRPIMYTNSGPDGQLFVSLPFAMMVGLMMDNFSEMSITLESMHVMFRQRANCFYPGWAYAMPTTLLRIPYSFLMAFLLSCIIYWVVGYDSNPGRCNFFLVFLCFQL